MLYDSEDLLGFIKSTVSDLTSGPHRMLDMPVSPWPASRFRVLDLGWTAGMRLNAFSDLQWF